MSISSNINLITVLIAGIFLIPILAGIINPLSKNRMQYSMVSLINSLEFLFAVILSVYLTKVIYSENGKSFLSRLFKNIPFVMNLLSKKDIWVYIITILVLLFFIICIIRLLTIPLYKYAIIPLSARVSSAVSSKNGFIRRMISAIWQLPRALWLVLIVSLLLNFFTSLNNNSQLDEYINSSNVYQLVYEKALNPLLSSSIAKQVPVLFNDSFKKTVENIFTKGNDTGVQNTQSAIPVNRKLQVIEYFNGMTLEDAVRSIPEIDNTARNVIGTESNDMQKAYLLYKWISKSVKYDYDKAQIIGVSSSKVASGSVVAFTTRKGVCFDFATLYVSMCRAVGIKVRFVTGLGYSGVAWGDHAWNQVYYPNENRWINVDTTFGSSGFNYFDKSDFSMDHQYDDIQGEW